MQTSHNIPSIMRNNPITSGFSKWFAIILAALLAQFAGQAVAAEAAAPAIELGAPFANNAILQREMPLPVWGWSKPGTTVAVEFAGDIRTGEGDAPLCPAI